MITLQSVQCFSSRRWAFVFQNPPLCPTFCLIFFQKAHLQNKFTMYDTFHLIMYIIFCLPCKSDCYVWFWYVDYRSAVHVWVYLTSCVLFFSDPGSIGLMVDKLISQFGQQVVNQWIAKGGSEQYPPSTLHVCSKNLTWQ